MAAFPCRGQFDFPCGTAGRFCIEKTLDFHILANKKSSAVIGSTWSGGGASFLFVLKIKKQAHKTHLIEKKSQIDVDFIGVCVYNNN